MRLRNLLILGCGVLLGAGLTVFWQNGGSRSSQDSVSVVQSSMSALPGQPNKLEEHRKPELQASMLEVQPAAAQERISPALSGETARVVEAKDAEIERAVERLDTATILRELNHSEPAVRGLALHALIRVEDPSTAPRVREIAETLTDPEEKKTLLEAADFLAAPSLAEAGMDAEKKPRAAGTPALKPAGVARPGRASATGEVPSGAQPLSPSSSVPR